MFELFAESHFSAAHRLVDYPGNCARWHGHNWHVRVTVQAEELDRLGMAVDLRRVKAALRGLIERFDHTDLNQIPDLTQLNPTCEVLARHLFGELARELNDDNVRVVRVQVSETPTAGAAYFE